MLTQIEELVAAVEEGTISRRCRVARPGALCLGRTRTRRGSVHGRARWVASRGRSDSWTGFDCRRRVRRVSDLQVGRYGHRDLAGHTGAH